MAQDSDIARVAAVLKTPGLRYLNFGNEAVRPRPKPPAPPPEPEITAEPAQDFPLLGAALAALDEIPVQPAPAAPPVADAPPPTATSQLLAAVLPQAPSAELQPPPAVPVPPVMPVPQYAAPVPPPVYAPPPAYAAQPVYPPPPMPYPQAPHAGMGRMDLPPLSPELAAIMAAAFPSAPAYPPTAPYPQPAPYPQQAYGVPPGYPPSAYAPPPAYPAPPPAYAPQPPAYAPQPAAYAPAPPAPQPPAPPASAAPAPAPVAPAPVAAAPEPQAPAVMPPAPPLPAGSFLAAFMDGPMPILRADEELPGGYDLIEALPGQAPGLAEMVGRDPAALPIDSLSPAARNSQVAATSVHIPLSELMTKIGEGDSSGVTSSK